MRSPQHNILCVKERIEARELEREGLQMAASLYGNKSSMLASLEQASTRSTAVQITVLPHLSARAVATIESSSNGRHKHGLAGR